MCNNHNIRYIQYKHEYLRYRTEQSIRNKLVIPHLYETKATLKYKVLMRSIR